METQDIIIYAVGILAVGFLVKKFFFKKKQKNGCSSDHNCKCG